MIPVIFIIKLFLMLTIAVKRILAAQPIYVTHLESINLIISAKEGKAGPHIAAKESVQISNFSTLVLDSGIDLVSI
jgi:hypothetical protein